MRREIQRPEARSARGITGGRFAGELKFDILP
jgi:hypothetical protein